MPTPIAVRISVRISVRIAGPSKMSRTIQVLLEEEV
jgi:hypothetical protein